MSLSKQRTELFIIQKVRGKTSSVSCRYSLQAITPLPLLVYWRYSLKNASELMEELKVGCVSAGKYTNQNCEFLDSSLYAKDIICASNSSGIISCAIGSANICIWWRIHSCEHSNSG